MARAELSCRGLVASPGGETVLHGVELEVAGGTLTVLTGPSGVGKTTLLRTVAGLQPLDAGAIHLADRDLDGVATHRRAIAYVFQEPRLFPNMSVAENVAFPLRMAGAGHEEREDRAREMLAEVGLEGLAERSTRGLSGGEAQRVALARALSGRPDLLLLDEPLASVDPSRREDLRRLIVDLQRRFGTTTLYVTHDRAEAAELGHRIAFMHDGRILQHGRPEDLFERPRSPVVAAFFGSTNTLTGHVSDGRLPVGEAALPVPGPDGPATFTIRPERVHLGGTGPLRLRATETVYQGGHVRVHLEGPGLLLEAHTDVGEAPQAGEVVCVELPPGALWRFPEDDPDNARRSAAVGRAGAT